MGALNLIPSPHFRPFCLFLTLSHSPWRPRGKKKKSFPACTVFPTPLLFRPCPFFYSPPSLILVLPFFPTLPPKTKLPAPSSLGPYIIPFGGLQYEWKVFFFSIKVAVALPPFLCLPLYPSLTSYSPEDLGPLTHSIFSLPVSRKKEEQTRLHLQFSTPTRRILFTCHPLL